MTKKNNLLSNYTDKSTDDNKPCEEWLHWCYQAAHGDCVHGDSTEDSWAALSVYVKWEPQRAIIAFEKKMACISLRTKRYRDHDQKKYRDN